MLAHFGRTHISFEPVIYPAEVQSLPRCITTNRHWEQARHEESEDIGGYHEMSSPRSHIVSPTADAPQDLNLKMDENGNPKMILLLDMALFELDVKHVECNNVIQHDSRFMKPLGNS